MSMRFVHLHFNVVKITIIKHHTIVHLHFNVVNIKHHTIVHLHFNVVKITIIKHNLIVHFPFFSLSLKICLVCVRSCAIVKIVEIRNFMDRNGIHIYIHIYIHFVFRMLDFKKNVFFFNDFWFDILNSRSLLQSNNLWL